MIPFLKLELSEESITLVNSTLRAGKLAQGDRVRQFERLLAEYCGVQEAVAVNSGTAALHLALLALGVTAGDEVITTPFTFGATVNAILMCGARPVFVDIEEASFLIDPGKIEEKLSKSTKAIIPVDIFGRLADYEFLGALAEKYHFRILEDACQAIGAERVGRKAGSFGDIGVFSLYATKNLFAGEGGVLVTDDSAMAERCRVLRNHGQSGKEKYDYLELGYNYRMTDVGAAMALPQLENIDQQNQRRIDMSGFYNEALRNIKGIELPVIEDKSSVFHLYTIRVTEEAKMNRDALQNQLYDRGAESLVYYPRPLHFYPMYRQIGYEEGDFPLAEKACREVLSLPIYPSLREAELQEVVQIISTIL